VIIELISNLQTFPEMSTTGQKWMLKEEIYGSAVEMANMVRW
jgi:hypothetical protein